MKTYHILFATVILFGCNTSTSGGAPDGVGGSGGSDDSPECVRTFDPRSGAENSSDCLQPDEPSCAAAYCGDDGACHVHNFPIGAKCSDTDSCDGQGHCKTLDVPCVGGCDDGNECTIDGCQTSNGMCFYGHMTEAHSCKNGAGHCNRDTGECCPNVIMVEQDQKFPDFKYYHCATDCPAGQVPDPVTSVCN